MEKSIQITLIIAVTVLLLAGAGFYLFDKAFLPQGDVITVSGSSTIDVTPDLVTVYLNVETSGLTSKEANDNNAKIVDEVITNLVKEGFERDEIQTLNFNIYPWQEWNGNKMVDKGYKASHQIKIQLKENQFNLIDEVIDAGANAGAAIGSINFELSNDKQNEYKALALKQAGQDAKAKAEGIASGVDKQVGAIVSITANEFNYNPWPVYNNRGGALMAEAADAKIATTNIAPSTQQVSGSVTVSYKLR